MFQADDIGTDWLKFGGSLTRLMSRKSTLFGDLGYARDLEDNGHAWTAKRGTRFNWIINRRDHQRLTFRRELSLGRQWVASCSQRVEASLHS